MQELAPGERSKRYRELGEQARKWAGTATSKTIRDDYLRVAARWFQLAESVENLN